MHILQMIDHTVLKANATQSDIEKLCAEAIKYEFASVCVNPVWVKTAKSLLENQNPKNCRPAVCTVIGFPLGATTTEQKVFETHTAIENGADEIDMVINIGNAKAGLWNDVQNDIALVVESAKEASQRTGRGKDKFALNPAQRPVCVKVIFENCYLTK
ncbi:MAG: deoxyribose-phosphate aldolase, partial [Spirochaetales bacterium]